LAPRIRIRIQVYGFPDPDTKEIFTDPEHFLKKIYLNFYALVDNGSKRKLFGGGEGVQKGGGVGGGVWWGVGVGCKAGSCLLPGPGSSGLGESGRIMLPELDTRDRGGIQSTPLLKGQSR
jgi:hypothetical protein